MRSQIEILIIGAGVIGSSIAYYLSRRGKKVLVVEKSEPASGTSGACDGFIITQTKSPGIGLQLARKSLHLLDSLCSELEDNLEYKKTGSLVIIETAEEWKFMESWVSQHCQEGENIFLLPPEELFRREPELNPHYVIGASYCPSDGQINPLNLNFALLREARKQGAEVCLYTEVLGFRFRGDKIVSAVTNRGEMEPEIVVNAAGVWAAEIALKAGIKLPIIPRRGQVLVSEPIAPIIHHPMVSARYLTVKFIPPPQGEKEELGLGFVLEQTVRGNLLLGSTREFVSFSRETTPTGILAIATKAMKIVPKLAGVNIIRTFAGLRPFTPDGLPILGKMPGFSNFYIAAGHEGDGITLAPVTGKIMAELILEGTSSFPLTQLSPERFPNIFKKE